MFGSQKKSGNTTVIGRGARFSGTLELEGAVHIEGTCEGTIRAQGQLSVGPHGSMVGELSANVMDIAGKVEGTVVAHDVLHVLKTGGVMGDAYYGRLQVDSGGTIDGRSHQGTPSEGVPAALPAKTSSGDGPDEEKSGVTSLFPPAGNVVPNTVNGR